MKKRELVTVAKIYSDRIRVEGDLTRLSSGLFLGEGEEEWWGGSGVVEIGEWEKRLRGAGTFRGACEEMLKSSGFLCNDGGGWEFFEWREMSREEEKELGDRVSEFKREYRGIQEQIDVLCLKYGFEVSYGYNVPDILDLSGTEVGYLDL